MQFLMCVLARFEQLAFVQVNRSPQSRIGAKLIAIEEQSLQYLKDFFGEHTPILLERVKVLPLKLCRMNLRRYEPLHQGGVL